MASRTRSYGVYVGIITLLAFHVQRGSTGHTIKCYSCSSKNSEACVKPDTDEYEPVRCDRNMLDKMKNYSREINRDYEKIFEVDSPNLHGVVDLVCLKLVVKDGNKDYVLRGCQLGMHSNLDICSKIDQMNTNTIRKVHCSKCQTDGCNSAMDSFQFNGVLTSLCIFASGLLSKL